MTAIFQPMTSLTPPGATPTTDTLERRFADFATLGEALDYAAGGVRGMNFHDARGTLVRAYPYADLKTDALAHARRFIALGLTPGDRLALVAETGAEFAACFFGAVYAGLWPVPLPLPTSFGGREAYVDQLVVMLAEQRSRSCSSIPPELADYCTDAAAQRGIAARAWDSLADVDPVGCATARGERGDIAYLQYISAARPASRMASRSPTVPCSTISTPTASGSRCRTATAASAGCPGIMTWAWSAACSRRSPTRSASIISRPRISPAARWPGSTSSAAIPARRSATRRPSAMTFARAG